MRAVEIADVLNRTKRKELDLDRKYSGGKGGAKSFINERVQSQNFAFAIENSSNAPVNIIIGSPIGSQFGDNQAGLAAMLAELGADGVLSDGVIIATATGDVVATPKNGRKISDAINFMAMSPTRLTTCKMISTKISDGSPAPQNYNGNFKLVFASPWRQPQEELISLRSTQTNASVSPQFGEVDFIKEGKAALVSNENFLVVTVEAGTRLDMSFAVGMQYSKAQEFYRSVKMADETLLSLEKGINSCEA